MSLKISDGLELEEQLPLPNLNTDELMKYLFETGQAVSVKIDGITYRNCKPKHKPQTAYMVLSFTILSDLKDTPIKEITSNGDIICRNDDGKTQRSNAKGLNFKMKFLVQIKKMEYGKYGVYVDGSSEAYDIINQALIERMMLPGNNSQAIKIRLDVLEKHILGVVLAIEVVQVNGRKGYHLRILKGE